MPINNKFLIKLGINFSLGIRQIVPQFDKFFVTNCEIKAKDNGTARVFW